MKWTNNHNLPLPIYNAIANSDYSKDGADFSVTELAMSAQERRLFRLHHSEIEKDIMSNVWAMLGSAMHSILEKASGTSDSKLLKFREQQLQSIQALYTDINDTAGHGDSAKAEFHRLLDGLNEVLDRQPPEINSHLMIEDRQWTKLANQTISGQVDVYDSDTATVDDYKVTGVYSYMKHMRGESRSWEIQLNCYRYLLTHNNYPVRKLEVVAIFRDWKGFEKFKENYPPTPMMILDIPVMDDIDVVQYMLDRIRIHSEATRYNNAKELAENVPCTNLERWANEKYSIKKVGGKKASATFDTFGEAKLYEAAHPQDKYIITDKSVYKKCEEYCDVSKFCAQHKVKSNPATDPPASLDDILTPEEPVDVISIHTDNSPTIIKEEAVVEEKPLSAFEKFKANRLLKEQNEAKVVVPEPVVTEETEESIETQLESTVDVGIEVVDTDEKPVELFGSGDKDMDDALKKLGL